MRGSLAEAEQMCWERVVSMRLTKRDVGSKVTPTFSRSSEGRRLG